MGTLLRKHGNAIHRLTGLLVSMGIIFSLLPGTLAEGNAETGTSTTETVTQTRLENGSFEIPAVDPDKDLTDADKTLDGKYWFLKPRTQVEQIAQDRHNTGFYWDTTAYNNGIGTGKIELAYPANRAQYGGEGKTAADGEQFAELCAQDQASLYQNLKTDPGAVYHWSLAHSARNSGENNGTESMALFIGAKQDAPLYKKNSGKGSNKNDIFMWMAKLLKEEGQINLDGSTLPAEKGEDVKTPISYTVYSQEDINVSEANITDANYTDYFSLTPNSEKDITKEWTCWIMTTKKSYGWQYYKGTYEIPVGQNETTFAFSALTGISNTEPGVINEGNLLDDIVFEKEYPLRVTTTAGGTGRVYSKFNTKNFDWENPVDNDHQLVVKEELVTTKDTTGKPHDHFRRYPDGTQLTVYAEPEKGYKFIGAVIDGAFQLAPTNGKSDKYFTPINLGRWDSSQTNAIYACHTNDNIIIMDRARYVQLIFTKENAVIFDPNGGYYNGTQENTVVTSSNITSLSNKQYVSKNAVYGGPNAVETDTSPVKFAGWYTASYPSIASEPNGAMGALVKGEVKIKYQIDYYGNNSTFDSEYYYTYGDKDTKRTGSTKAADGMTFIAQWEYLQTAKAMTMEQTALDYEYSMKGGTVEITRMEGTESKVTGRTVNTYDDNGGKIDQGGGAVSKGYARMKDNIELTAKPNKDYVFVGWYDEDTGELLSEHSTVYSYELGKGARTFQARFRAVLQYPYLSFVSKDEVPATTEEPFNEGTSLRVGKNKVENYTAQQDGGIGGKKYGNTISTGFSTMQTINNIAYDRCLWTITIPAVSSGNPVYIKSNTELKADMKATEILPNDNAARNPGAIYKVGSLDKQEIKLRSMLPEISGEGQIVFAVILDNIYAPGAYAMLDLKTQSDDITEGSDELNDNNSYSYSTSNGTYNYYDHISSQTTNIP